MKPPASLSLLIPPQGETRLSILRAFFGQNDGTDEHVFQNFLENYSRELRQLTIGVDPVLRPIKCLATKTHDDIFYVCSVLSAKRSMPRHKVRECLKSRFPGPLNDNLSIDRSIDLSVRLWLMLNVRDEELSVVTPQTPTLHWIDDISLEQFISAQFPPSVTELTMRESRLDPSFTVANLVRICGLQIQWTTSLEDHLRLDRRRNILSVFSFKDFLAGRMRVAKAAVEVGNTR